MPIAYSQILNCQERILIQIFSAGAHLGLYKYVWRSFFSGKFQVPIFFCQSQNLVKKEREKDKKTNITFIKFNSVCHKSVVKKGRR